MGKKNASRSPIGSFPPLKDFLKKRVFRLLGRSRENPFIWGCGPAGFGIITLFSRDFENKDFQCPWYQLEGCYRCIKTFVYNIGIAAAKPLQCKRKLFPPLFTEYRLDHQPFTQHFSQDFYSRLKVLSILTLDIFQEVLPVADLQ